jgi:predicted nucleic acid-binding Zn ribbon protein
MYNPSPFLICAAALTSIFSFFFGGYFLEREIAYRLWIRLLAYDGKISSEDERKSICAEIESKERLFRQTKGLLWMMLLTLICLFVIFQFYSFKYINEASPFYQPDSYHTYFWFSAIIGIIILINCLEMLYINVGMERVEKFPYFRFRKRVTGQERLFMVWQLLDCHNLKITEHQAAKIPKNFYRALKKLEENESHSDLDLPPQS